jgi:hypothetical protein
MGLASSEHRDFEDTVPVEMIRYRSFDCGFCESKWSFSELEEGVGVNGDVHWFCPNCQASHITDDEGTRLMVQGDPDQASETWNAFLDEVADGEDAQDAVDDDVTGDQREVLMECSCGCRMSLGNYMDNGGCLRCDGDDVAPAA